MGLGRRMAKRLIDEAIGIGYRSMLLDTLDSMKPAIALYQSLGFRQIAPYYSNPSERAVFMELLMLPGTNKGHPEKLDGA